MIPHHQQAVQMADYALADQSEASPQVRELAQQIKAAQGPEIEQMTQWLRQWGAATAMPSEDGDMSGHDMGGMTTQGMMTDADMAALGNATGKQLDRMWLEMMIEHHRGAILMAQQVKAASTNPDVVRLADAIINGQQAEITTMQNDLAELGAAPS